MRPDVNVTTREDAPPTTIPTSVGVGFMIGITEAGPLLPDADDAVFNYDEYSSKHAPHGDTFTSGMMANRSAKQFFTEGGGVLFVGRVLGDAAAAATGVIGTSWNITATSPGTWGNDITVEVLTPTEEPDIEAGHVRIQVRNDADTELYSESPDIGTIQEGIDWSADDERIRLTGSSGSVVPAATVTTALASGADDTAGVDNDSWQAGFDSLASDLGPGVAFAPGQTTDPIHQMLSEHARVNGRVQFADGADTPTAATLITSSKNNTDETGKRSRYTGLFAPWLIVGDPSGASYTLPPSPSVAGLFCRNMSAGLSANEPAAGENGRFRNVLGVTQKYSNTDRANLNKNGVNVILNKYGVRKVYGWRTTADPVNDKKWINLGNSLLHRQIVALSGAVGERFIFRQIDGQRLVITEFGGALAAEVCVPLYLAGSLHGDSMQDAFKVDVGPSVNTDATIADNQLRAVISVKMSPFGEEVNIEIVKYLITDTIPA